MAALLPRHRFALFRQVRGEAARPLLFGGTERRYGAGGEEMATSSLHVTDGVPRCPSRTT